MTQPTNWITDRPPTAADADKNGAVIIDCIGSGIYLFRPWSIVGTNVPWRHTEDWQPPATPESKPTKPAPRKFASISRTVTDFGHIIDAIDEDGVAWWMMPAQHDSAPEWHQLLPLPGREVFA